MAFPTLAHNLNGETVFVCPYSGRTRFHRFGFPKFKKGTFDGLVGSYTTYGCAIADLQQKLASGLVKDKKAVSMLADLSAYLSSFNGQGQEAFTTKDVKTVDEALERLGIQPAPPAKDLRLFGGETNENVWALAYDEAGQIHMPGFQLGYMFVSAKKQKKPIADSGEPITYPGGESVEEAVAKMDEKMRGHTFTNTTPIKVQLKAGSPPKTPKKPRKRKSSTGSEELKPAKRKLFEE